MNIKSNVGLLIFYISMIEHRIYDHPCISWQSWSEHAEASLLEAAEQRQKAQTMHDWMDSRVRPTHDCRAIWNKDSSELGRLLYSCDLFRFRPSDIVRTVGLCIPRLVSSWMKQKTPLSYCSREHMYVDIHVCRSSRLCIMYVWI